jgi:hypothetical protein
MAAKKAPPSGVILVRLSDTFIPPPGLLGWNHLIEPDVFETGDGKKVESFQLNHHQTEAQADALVARLDKLVIAPLWVKFLAAAAEAGRPTQVKVQKGKSVDTPWPMPTAQDFVDSHLQPFPEGASIEQPYMRYSNAAYYMNREGVRTMKTMRATDKAGSPLDLKKLKLGMKSVIQPLLQASIYSSAAFGGGVPALSLKLQGIRIIKLEQWGGGGPAVGEITEEDMALLGDDVEAEDLSAYSHQDPPVRRPTEEAGGAAEDDDDVEVPF